MKQKLKIIFSSQGLLQSLKTLIGSTFATGISAISLMIYSRVLGPEKFGEFSVGFALVMILTRINDIGFNNAILRYGSEKDEKNVKIKVTDNSIEVVGLTGKVIVQSGSDFNITNILIIVIVILILANVLWFLVFKRLRRKRK